MVILSKRITAFYRRIGGYAAMIEYVSTFLLRISLALRGQINRLVGDGVDLAVVKHGLAVAKDEIDLAFDVAVVKILPGRNAGPGV